MLLILFVTGFFYPATAQEEAVTALLGKKPLEADVYFGTDNLGYIYFSKGNVFCKQKDNEFYQYKNPALGNITKADINNPLNIILFYEPFNMVISLDNQLNEIRKINFSEPAEPMAVTATGLASQNHLWVFNSLNMRLGLYDTKKNSVHYIGTPFTHNVKFYHSDFNYFYWIDTQNNRYVCDIFGKTIFLGKAPDAEKVIFVSNYELLYLKNNELWWFNFQKDNPTKLSVDKKTFQNFSYKEQILTIFTEKEISTYKITLP